MTDSDLLHNRLRELVSKRASALQHQYREDVSSAVAALAQLRRGVGRAPGQRPDLIGLTIAGLYADQVTLKDEPTPAENAAFAALTLFALHQQSHRNASMHRAGYSFGRTARLLGRHSKSRDSVRMRFTATATSDAWSSIIRHASALIQQFRAHSIPLDYGQFAVDLYRLQYPDGREKVRLAWGRDFYRINDPDDDTADAQADTVDDSTAQ